ncbi:dimethylarginine dimethylaminohydrolase family protein [Dokdonella sp.]|uniref:dimethylarginine dimethylaminohydrolase family protein n=1 Tax=Dokdonella sp. TaxID=2291710 RepID=UPI003C4AD29A
MLIALTRKISPRLADCELTHLAREPIDIELAVRQHATYVKLLATLGCASIELEAMPQLADSVFVEDVAIVLDEVAIMTRPGAASRRPETESMVVALERHRPLLRIETPGQLDGGDVLRIGRTVYVGQSGRSNAEGIDQLRSLLARFGYAVHAVPIRDCLHLKSAVTSLDDQTIIVQPAWLDRDSFDGFRVIEVDPEEAHAANVLRVGEQIVMPACFPRTQQRIESIGFHVNPIDVSELQKAEGAVTCCSLVFESMKQAPA